MLSQLLRDERSRFYLWLTVLLAATLPVVGLFLLGMLAGTRRNPAGLFCCAAQIGIFLFAAWGVFARRFLSLSSVRGLPDQLARYGPLDEVLKQIDADLANLRGAYIDGRVTVEIGSPQPNCLIVTDRWLVRLDPGASAVVRLDDLVWVWRRDVLRSAPLTMGRLDHQVGYRLRGGHVGLFDAWTERRTAHALEELLHRRPELLAGYRGEWHELADRGGDALAGEVRARRERYDRLSDDEKAAWVDAALDECHRYVLRVDRQLPAGK